MKCDGEYPTTNMIVHQEHDIYRHTRQFLKTLSLLSCMVKFIHS